MSAVRRAGVLPLQMPPGPGDEVSPRSWEKRAEIIDSKKDELNKDQWRLIRDHVHMNIREISKIFRDLDSIKSAHSQFATATAERELKMNEELRTEIANLKKDLEDEKSQRAVKTSSIERLLVSLTDRLSANDSADETLRQKMELNVAGLRNEAKEKHQVMMDRINSLETALSEDVPGAISEVKDAHRKLQGGVNQQIDSLKAMHETHVAATLDAVALEKAAREQAWNDLHQHVHRRVGEEKAARDAHIGDLHRKLEAEKCNREDHMRNTSDLINAEKTRREKMLSALQAAHDSSLAHERQFRENAHAELRAALAREKQGRDGQHCLFHGKLEEERAAREAHAKELLSALDAHRGTNQQTLQDELAKERKLRDAAHNDLRRLIDGNHGKLTSLLEAESAARAAHVDDSLGKALGKEAAARENMMQELFDKCRAEGDLVLQQKIEGEFADREARLATLRGLLEADVIAREEDVKRIEYIEKVVGGGYLADPTGKRMATVQSQLETLRKKLEEEIIEEKQARERFDRSVTESFRKDKIERERRIKDEIAIFKKILIASFDSS